MKRVVTSKSAVTELSPATCGGLEAAHAATS